MRAALAFTRLDYVPLDHGPNIAYGHSNGVWIMILHKPPTAADMHRARRPLKQMAAMHPEGFATLTWVLPSAGFMLDAEARRAANDVTGEYSPNITAVATLIEGNGLQASAVRGIIAGLALVDGMRVPRKVFSQLGACTQWSVGFSMPQPGLTNVNLMTAALSELGAELNQR